MYICIYVYIYTIIYIYIYICKYIYICIEYRYIFKKKYQLMSYFLMGRVMLLMILNNYQFQCLEPEINDIWQVKDQLGTQRVNGHVGMIFPCEACSIVWSNGFSM